MTNMTDRKFQLTDVFVDKNIDESFKCGICMDILKSPILCGGGHSWCFDCIKCNKNTKCPICPEIINAEKPQPNFTVIQLIDKMTCKCPNNSIEIGQNSESQQKKKRNENYSRSDLINETALCQWTGRYDQLDNHLKNCSYKSCQCDFAVHGCNFVGTKISVNDHYQDSNHSHKLILSNKIIKLENKSVLDEVTILKLKEELLDIKNEIINNECNSIKRFRDISQINENSIINWRITDVMKRLKEKATISSEVFDIITMTGKKYKFFLEAGFGLYTPKGFGLYLFHHSCPGYCDEVPINICGTTLCLLNEDPVQSVSMTFDHKDYIYSINSGRGL